RWGPRVSAVSHFFGSSSHAVALAGTSVPFECELCALLLEPRGRKSDDTRASPPAPAPGPMEERTVRAGELGVGHDQGRGRRRIGLSNDQAPFLSLLAPDGQVRARFGLGADGSAGLAIGDDNGKVRATVGLSTDGSASLAFGDKRGRIRAKFGLAPEASPTM